MIFEDIALLISDVDGARIAKAMESQYMARGKGLTDRDFFIDCLRRWITDLVINDERDRAMSSVEPDEGLIDFGTPKKREI